MPVAVRQGFGYKNPMAERPEIQRIERLMPLADALACIDGMARPVAPCRTGLGRAVGFTLAEQIVNRYAHPGSAIALRDGVAVDAAATLEDRKSTRLNSSH